MTVLDSAARRGLVPGGGGLVGHPGGLSPRHPADGQPRRGRVHRGDFTSDAVFGRILDAISDHPWIW